MNDGMSVSMNPMARIKSEYDSFSNTQKRIADLLLNKADKACFLSLKEFSKEAGVSPLTVINFSRLINYQNFSDLKKDMQNYIQGIVSSRNIFRNTLPDIGNESLNSLLETVITREKELLEETFRVLSVESIVQSADRIMKARKILIAAFGMFRPVAQILELRLRALTLQPEILSLESTKTLAGQISQATSDDVFVLFSFPTYDERGGSIASCARSLGCKVICITDNPSSPPALFADNIILCQTANLVFYNSMTAPVSVVNLLASLLALEMQDRVEENNARFATVYRYLES